MKKKFHKEKDIAGPSLTTYRTIQRWKFHLESDSRQWFPPASESTLNTDARPSSFIFYAFSPAMSSTPRQVFCRSNSKERVPTTKRSARWTLIRRRPRYQRGPPGSSGGFNETAIKGHRTVHFHSFCINLDVTGITNLPFHSVSTTFQLYIPRVSP